MIYGFDFEAKPEEVRLYLCRPNGNTIAELSTAYKRKLTLNYGGIHQLSFQIPYKVFHDGEFIKNTQIDFVRGHYLVRLEKGNELKEYFIITNPVNSTNDGQEIKSVTCYLRPFELKDKLVRSYKGVKLLSEVLNDTLLTQTDYKVGYIDSSLALKYRSFDISEQTLLEFLSDLAETYGGVIVWDSYNKTINFYLDQNMVFDDGLEITYGKYLKSLQETEKFDDVCTRLYCYGKNGISINSVSSIGAYYIEDYSFYMYPFERDANKKLLKHSYYMSDSLCHALLDYQALVESKSSTFRALLSQRETNLRQQTPLEVDLDALNRQMDFIEKQIAVWVALNQSLTANSLGVLKISSSPTTSGNIIFNVVGAQNKTISVNINKAEDTTYAHVAAKVLSAFKAEGFVAILESVNNTGVIQFQLPNSGGVTNVTITNPTGVQITSQTTSLNGQKAAKVSEIAAKQSQIDGVQNLIDGIDAQINSLKQVLAIDANFSQALKKEWSSYIKERSWTDTNYTNATDLYEEGKRRLSLINQPIVAYEVNSVDFKSAINTSHDWNKAKLGGVVRIYYPNFNINVKTKIIVLDWDIDGKSIKFTIANTKDIKSGILKLKDLIKGSVSTSATLNMSKSNWDKADSAYNQFTAFINDKFDANKQSIIAGDNENYTLNRYGLTLKDPNDPLNYLRGLHNILAFTNDGGQTYKHAITPNGIVGEYIYGTLGVFAKINASSIVIGADGTAIPDTVIASSHNWNSMYGDAVGYTDGKVDDLSAFVNSQVTQINESITTNVNELNEALDEIGGQLDQYSNDNMITLAEANALALSQAQVDKESLDVITVAVSLGITTEKNNYQSAINALNAELNNKWVNQPSYPKAITDADRANIKAKFSDVQNYKSILINKISSVRQDQTTSYVNQQVTSLNTALNTLEDEIDLYASDEMVTLAEAQSLIIAQEQVNKESTDLINVATILGITTEKNNYQTSLNSLNTELTAKWVNQTSYPKAVTASDRTIIKSKFATVQNNKSVLVNKISSTRQDQTTTYINSQVTELNNSLDNMDDQLQQYASDSVITLAEAKALEISQTQVNKESLDFIAIANSLTITTEKTNYQSAINALNAELDTKWINQASYPKAISPEDRTNIKNKFADVQNYKSILINKIAAVRATNAQNAANAHSDANLQAAKVYSDNTLVTAKGYSDTINSNIRNDLRLTAALPTSITLNGNGITATTSDATKFARLDYRGLYIQNGALQITSTDGTTVIDGSGVNASKIYTGSLNGIYMTIGTGNTVFKADANGIYLGNTVFASAPFRVDMNGNVTANNITLSGTITSSNMSNSTITGSTLTIGSGNSIFKADSNGIYLGNASFSSAPFRVSMAGNLVANNATLTNATISGNITMTGGSISWANVGSDPSIATAQSAANAAAAVANNSVQKDVAYNGVKIDTANGLTVTSGTVTSRFNASSGILIKNYDSTVFSVDTSGNVFLAGKIFSPGYQTTYMSIERNFGDLSLYALGSKFFTIYNDVGNVSLRAYGTAFLNNNGSTTYPVGTWNFTNTSVTGLTAKFG